MPEATLENMIDSYCTQVHGLCSDDDFDSLESRRRQVMQAIRDGKVGDPLVGGGRIRLDRQPRDDWTRFNSPFIPWRPAALPVRQMCRCARAPVAAIPRTTR